jgi:transcriptional regulator with XRE-family HTH domain
MDFDVGGRLRDVRIAKGLSQRQLATRSGVTSGMISMIEQNRTNPSVASLKKILDALPMTMSAFFNVDAAEEQKFVFRAHELTEIAPRIRAFIGKSNRLATVSLRQVGDVSKHALQILHETYPPGGDTGPEMLVHEAEEGGVIISGFIELTVGDQVSVLGPGDAYLFDSRIPHRFRNAGDEICVIVSASTPPSF